MRSVRIVSFILTFNKVLILVLAAASHRLPFWKPSDQITSFYKCVNYTSNSRIKFSDGFYDPKHDVDSFTAILNSTALNLRCLAKTLQKPIAIFTPSNDKQVQSAVQCSFFNGLNIRVRSGGHDYEGLSYISYTGQPFVVVDLRKIRNVDIDIKERIAWVDAGMTIGELYYWISQKSKTLAFPAGIYPDLGVGGHLTGGAYGSLMRKYGLGVDNMLDAQMVDAWGNILDKASMGEDLFWAIRGGGGANFGVILRLKIQLVPIPERVTVFSVQKLVSLANKSNLRILQKWQTAAPTIANELFIRVLMVNAGSNNVLTIYQALYLGNTADLLKVMKTSFPELGLLKANCFEMSWIESVIVNAGFQPPIPPKDLLKGKGAFLNYFKSKSDYVVNPIPEKGLLNMLNIICEGGTAPYVIWTPYGGKMGTIPENETAFPHREGILFKTQYVANWHNASARAQLEHEAWVRKLYDNMIDYVTSDPRQSYVNYRDLDIGKPFPNWNCSDPRIWGPKYYKKENYRKLVKVKTMVDPLNVFNNEQSIPTAYTEHRCRSFDMMART